MNACNSGLSMRQRLRQSRRAGWSCMNECNSVLPSSLRMRFHIRKRPSRWRGHMNECSSEPPNKLRMRFSFQQEVVEAVEVTEATETSCQDLWMRTLKQFFDETRHESRSRFLERGREQRVVGVGPQLGGAPFFRM